MNNGLQVLKRIKDGFLNDPQFPFDKTSRRRANKPHLRTIAWASADGQVREIAPNVYEYIYGDTEMEEKYPHYHILEDAKIIRKGGRSTKKTRGSQASVLPLGQRDYGKVLLSRETGEMSQEYRKPSTRKNYEKKRAEAREFRRQGEDKNYYHNIHYRYIETILDKVMPRIATELGGKLRVITGFDLGIDEFEYLENDGTTTPSLLSGLSLTERE